MTCKVRHRVLDNQKVYAVLTGHTLRVKPVTLIAIKTVE
jgi:hypothetical protein